jgi:hypothetical protein
MITVISIVNTNNKMFHAADGPTTHRITWLGGTHVIMRKFTAEKAYEYIGKYKVSRYVISYDIKYLV